ncbi:MAG: PA14 domain-containing protein [Kineosporiaceae bacterium]
MRGRRALAWGVVVLGLLAAGVAPAAAATSPPVVTITGPLDGEQFSAGGAYRLRAIATDPDGGRLADSALTWVVLRHQGAGTDVYLGPVQGNDVPLTAPQPASLAATTTTWLEIQLTARDDNGGTTVVSRHFRPRTVPVTLATYPPGRRVAVNGSTLTGPATITSWAGLRLTVASWTQTDPDARSYVLERWSDGGAASHTVVTPTDPLTLTAYLGLRGLIARFYPTPDLTGTSVDRLAGTVDADWGSAAPFGLPPDGFSARWSGQLVPQFSQFYKVSVVVDDGARLWVNGVSADGWGVTGAQTLTVTVPLTAGVPARVQVDYRERGGPARVQLRWSSPSRAEQVVPLDRLLPRYSFAFGPATTAAPSGYLRDHGGRYAADRGLGSGWSADLSGVTRDRRVLADPCATRSSTSAPRPGNSRCRGAPTG